MRIIFLFSDNFPGNSAYSNRIQSLAKGLIHAGNEVEVSVVYPGRKSTASQSSLMRGKSDGVPFRYYCMHKYKPSNIFFRKVEGIVGVLNFSFRLLFKSRINRPDFIILGSSNLFHLLTLFFFGKIRGVKLIREKNEFPRFVLHNTSYFAKISRYKLLDGFIFMTSKLSNYFYEELGVSKKSTIINMTVDTQRFNHIEPYNTNEDYLLLVGDIVGDKDGVGGLFHSFKKVHQRYPELKLYLAGNISNKEGFERRIKQVEELGLKESVVFLGVVNRRDIPSLMTGAKLLLLPRPSTKQADGGFPTKLGEYLATGVPTVVTRTGVISDFLEDNVNSFLVQPDDPSAFSNKIVYALENYCFAKAVGEKGKDVVKDNFSCISQGQKLHEFLIDF